MSGARCPICGGRDDQPILEASGQPLLLNRLLPTRSAALDAPRCTLDFRGCVTCGFVRNAAFRPEDVVYGPGYVNDQSGSAVFRAHLDQVTRHLADLIDGVPGTIVEVGCGQGGFLAALCAATGRAGVGFDPALTRSGEIAPRVLVRNEFFDGRSLADATEPIALIYCRHVLEHIADPPAMIRVMSEALAGSPRAALYVEVPTFEWIARQGAFFDLFSEHCSLFGPASMRRALADAELSSIDVRTAFAGQYLAATARGARSPAVAPITTDVRTHDWRPARERLARERNAWRDRFASLRAAGPTCIWGGAAKGVSVVNHLGLTHGEVPCLVDINPAKQGAFVPVTGQEVISPETLARRLRGEAGATVVVMNPNYEGEIAQQLRSLGCEARIETIRGSMALEVQR